MEMNNRCPACGTRFDREPGYFTGAIPIGIVLGAPIALLLAAATMALFPSMHPAVAAIVAMIAFLPVVPLILRFSRVIWMRIGRPFSPDDYPDDDPPPTTDEQPAPDPVPGGKRANPRPGSPRRNDMLRPPTRRIG